MRLEIKTFRSEHFAVRLKRWWLPSDRKAARLALKLAESDHEEIFRETSKRLAREWFFGENP